MSIDTSLLKNWIRENPEKVVSAKIVAARFDVSVHTLYKEFIRKENVTIGRFIEDTRLEAVKHILLTTEKRGFEIAHEFTFGREDVLARWFKQRTGMTMGEFREKTGWQRRVGRGGGKPKRI
jgi:AraC-like DNA-binding protein